MFNWRRPTDLGVKDGRFAPCKPSPNCVSSQADAADREHYIAPIAFRGTMADVRKAVESMQRSTVISASGNYLYAEYRTRLLNEWKRQGLILDYKFFTKPTFDGPNDWDIMEAVQYKNYHDLLDYEEARSKRFEELILKVVVSVENRNKVWAELRDASREVIASQIVREMQIKQ